MRPKVIIIFFIGTVQSLSEPCAEVSASWAAQATATFTQTYRAQVPAQLALDCLMSVPVDVDGDLKLIKELQNFLQFHSTLSYLKDGYYVNQKIESHNEPLDLLARLSDIAISTRNGTYQNDFEVQLTLHTLFRHARDSHLRFLPDILEIFLFVRPESQLVSISGDGVALPHLYLLSDLEVARASVDFMPSSVSTINGRDATEYLEKLWTHNIYHDADARYNGFFPNPAAATVEMDSGGQFYLTQGLYDGPVTEFGFVNGSLLVKENVAVIREVFDFSGVTNGRTFFSKFCQGDIKGTKTVGQVQTSIGTTMKVTSSSSAILAPTGYPQPLIAQSGLSVQGYYLNNSRYLDVAILALPNFKPVAKPTQNASSTITGFIEAQATLRDFFSQCAQKEKIKLVIDLRGNSGGTIDMAFELFKQIFPSVEPFGASRFRAHEAFYLYSWSVADLVENKIAAVTDDQLFAEVASSTANSKNLLNIEGTPFANFTTYYGPYQANKDTFTAARRYNFSNHFGGHTLAPHVNLTGYDSAIFTSPSQLFQAENIIILQDGSCRSACAIFSQLMKEQGHVQTIAIGGRPRNEPMQGVGGTKGAQLLRFDSIVQHMQTTLRITSILHGAEAAQQLLQRTAVGNLLNTSQIYIRSAHFSGDGRSNGAVNSLDNLSRGDPTATPLEFVYEAADCRLFYTRESFFSPVPLWEMAVDTKWGDKKCVHGSMGHATSIGMITGQSFNAGNSVSWSDNLRVSITSLIVMAIFVWLIYFLLQSLLARGGISRQYQQLSLVN